MCTKWDMFFESWWRADRELFYSPYVNFNLRGLDRVSRKTVIYKFCKFKISAKHVLSWYGTTCNSPLSIHSVRLDQCFFESLNGELMESSIKQSIREFQAESSFVWSNFINDLEMLKGRKITLSQCALLTCWYLQWFGLCQFQEIDLTVKLTFGITNSKKLRSALFQKLFSPFQSCFVWVSFISIPMQVWGEFFRPF